MHRLHISRFAFLLAAACCGVHAALGHAQSPAPLALDSAALADIRDGLPLEPTRMLSFTATEGSWMSVDVSPDGRTLVFDLLGDLYTVPIEGGRATPLTRGMAYNSQPRFSPDGRRIAYKSDRNGGTGVWILPIEGGEPVQVTRGKDNRYVTPSWSPDGQYILVTRENQLMLYHVGGGGGVQLLRSQADTRPQLRYLGGAFSPDGRTVWAARYSLGFLPTHNIIRHDLETGVTSEFGMPTRGSFRPTLSPDGRWIVYGTRYRAQTGLRIRDLHTGEDRWLAYPVQRDEMDSSQSPLDAYPGMAFTPDSKELIAFYGGGLWRIPIDGGAPRPIPFEAPVEVYMGPAVQFEYEIPDDPRFSARQIRHAVPSPDGRRLAFTALERLYVMDWPDGTPQRVTSATALEYTPAWSPDGQWLVYATWSDTARAGHLMRVRARSGARPERLTTESAYYAAPVYSPDGARIVALRSHALDRVDLGNRVTREIVWVPAGGGAATVVAPAGGFVNPHFRLDAPDRILLFDEGSRDRVVSMRFDGTDERDELRTARRASAITMAPRGDQALVQVQMKIHVVTVPPRGGEPPRLAVGSGAELPSRELTDAIGGESPTWNRDGRSVHWTIGSAHVAYDLAGGSRSDGYSPLERRIEVRAERDLPRGTVALTGARILTMRGHEIIEDGTIVIRDHRIAEVGPRTEVGIPDGAREIDARGRTIVPGFIDTHAHLWGERMGDASREQSNAFIANLAYGVTTLREPASGTSVLTYADRVTAGDLIGPRVFTTGPAINRAPELFSPTGTPGDLTSLEAARTLVRRYSEYYRTNYIKQYSSGNREQRQWLIQAAREQGIMPTTEGGGEIERSLTEAIDGYSGHEHTYTGYPHYGDYIRLFAASGTAYTPTILVSYGGPQAESWFYVTEDLLNDEKLARFTIYNYLARASRRMNDNIGVGWFHEEEHVFRDIAKTVADIVAAGGRAAVGSHGQLQGIGYHWELWAMQSGGLSEHDALRSATIMGAEALGLQREIGSIEQGKLADLLVLRADPLANIRNTNTIEFVVANGRVFDGDTLAEIHPRPGPTPTFYWQFDPPNTAAGVRP